jgi:hypothetical protein
MGARTGLVVTTLSAALASGCIPYALPPGQAGFGFARDTSVDRTVVRLSAGVHTASIPRLVEKPLDFGVGYMGDLYSNKEGEPSKVRTHGLYGEASRFVYKRPFFRTSLGARAEVLFGGGEVGWGALARGAAELYKDGVYVPDSNDVCRIHGGAGAFAFGVYVESGYERLPNGIQAFASTAGFTFRWPFAYGMIFLPCADVN